MPGGGGAARLGSQPSPLVCGVAGGRPIPTPLTANALSPMISLLAFFKTGGAGSGTGIGGIAHFAFLLGLLLLGEGTGGGGIGAPARLAFPGGITLGGLADGGDAALEGGTSLIGETDLRSKIRERESEREKQRTRGREKEREREIARANMGQFLIHKSVLQLES